MVALDECVYSGLAGIRAEIYVAPRNASHAMNLFLPPPTSLAGNIPLHHKLQHSHTAEGTKD